MFSSLSPMDLFIWCTYTWQAVYFIKKGWVDTRMVFIIGWAYTWKFTVARDDKLTYADFSLFKFSMLSFKYSRAEFITWGTAREKPNTQKAVYWILFAGTMCFSYNNKRSFPGSRNPNKIDFERYLKERSAFVWVNLLVFLFW